MQFETIVSPQNKIIKQVTALRQKKHRDELGLFTVEGLRLCEAFAAADWQCDCCVFAPSIYEKDRGASLLRQLSSKGAKMIQVPQELFDKLGETEKPQGVLIIARKKETDFNELIDSSIHHLLVILDEIQDPGNIGAIIRIADAAGCTGVILTNGSADIFAGKTVRSTMGSLFHLPVVQGVARPDLVVALKKAGILLAATAMDGDSIYNNSDLSGPLALAFGNEGRGISDELAGFAALRLAIPIYGRAESLNVGAAAAVILYECARQRRLTL